MLAVKKKFNNYVAQKAKNIFKDFCDRLQQLVPIHFDTKIEIDIHDKNMTISWSG